MASADNRPAGDAERDATDPATLLGAYALHALPPEDAAAVEAYLAAYPDAAREAAGLKEAAAMLPYSVESATPNPALRLRLMAAVYQEALDETRPSASARPAPIPLRPRARVGGFFWPVAAAILLMFTVGFGGWSVTLRRDVRNKDQALATERAAAATLNTSAVQGTTPGAPTRGEVIKLGSTQNAVLTISGLPPLAAGRVYQVWFISGSTPVGAGLFAPNPDGSWSGLVTGNLASAQAIAISVEPTGGSPAPTGDIVAKGSL